MELEGGFLTVKRLKSASVLLGLLVKLIFQDFQLITKTIFESMKKHERRVYNLGVKPSAKCITRNMNFAAVTYLLNGEFF